MKFPATRTQCLVVTAAVAMLLLLAIAARVYAYGPAKGLFYRTFQTPPILHASFIEDFDKQQAQAQRERLIRTYHSRSGSYGLRKTVSSIEGSPIGRWLIVQDGHLTIVSDYTHDMYGNREFGISYSTNVVLSVVEPSEASVPFTPPEGQIVLKCYLQSGGVFYF